MLRRRRQALAAAVAHRSRQRCPTTKKAGATTAASRKARRSTRTATRSSTTCPRVGTPPRTTASAGGGCSKRWSSGSRRGATKSASIRAHFLHAQFGVQTMAEYRHSGSAATRPTIDDKNETGTWALDTLGEDETIARLATGIKRFKLPDEHNFIKLYQQVVDDRADDGSRRRLRCALRSLAEIFREPPAISARGRVLAAGRSSAPAATCGTHYQQRLDQIVGNWGQFEGVMTQPAGRGATVDFRFRNGKQVEFDGPRDQRPQAARRREGVSRSRTRSSSTGSRSTSRKSAIGSCRRTRRSTSAPKSPSGTLDLEPRDKHFDRRITVTTPLQKAGAYLVTAKVDGRQHVEDRRLGRRHGDRPQADAGQGVLLRRRRRHRRADRQGERRVLRLPAAARRRQQLSGRHQELRAS